eukprot:COSAG02_NODE_9918_length_2075_cov_1.946862_2_plen_53_part_01
MVEYLRDLGLDSQTMRDLAGLIQLEAQETVDVGADPSVADCARKSTRRWVVRV